MPSRAVTGFEAQLPFRNLITSPRLSTRTFVFGQLFTLINHVPHYVLFFFILKAPLLVRPRNGLWLESANMEHAVRNRDDFWTTTTTTTTMTASAPSGGTGSSLARAVVIVSGVSSLVASLLSLV